MINQPSSMTVETDTVATIVFGTNDVFDCDSRKEVESSHNPAAAIVEPSHHHRPTLGTLGGTIEINAFRGKLTWTILREHMVTVDRALGNVVLPSRAKRVAGF